MRKLLGLTAAVAIGGLAVGGSSATAFTVIDRTSCSNPFPGGDCGYTCKCKRGQMGGRYETMALAEVGCAEDCKPYGGCIEILKVYPSNEAYQVHIRDILAGKVKPDGAKPYILAPAKPLTKK
jgi:hypothetical protein